MVRTNENRESQSIRSTFRLWPLLAVAAYFRFRELGIKPPHFDEGINGHFVMTIWRDGFYTYDPTNFHGPLYFYLLHGAEVLFGRGVESFRIMNAFLAMGLVFFIFQFRRFLGPAAVVAAWIIAVSPAFTFYGRYAIHETLFILGQIAFVYGRLVWFGKPTREAVGLIATGLLIMIATKETFFIFVGTWIIAEIAIWLLEKFEKSELVWSRLGDLTQSESRRLVRDTAVISSIALFLLFALYTGFFEHSRGAGDFFRAFDFWTKTGTKGNGHEKPFLYWLETMGHYEWVLLIGLATSAVATLLLKSQHRAQRLILLTGFGTWLAYSIIPYKTPWLLLGFWPLAFLLLPQMERGKWRILTAVILGLTLVHSTLKSYRLNFVDFAKAGEPYVYVQTTTDYSNVMDVLKRKIRQSPSAGNLSLVIMIQDPWPLPYEVALFPNLKYAKIEDIDRDPSIIANADLMLIDGSILDGLRNVLPKKFGRMDFRLRDSYDHGWALFDFEKFRGVLAADVPIEDPAESPVKK
jgi:uncharacterized protein (TIGR03663 family)